MCFWQMWVCGCLCVCVYILSVYVCMYACVTVPIWNMRLERIVQQAPRQAAETAVRMPGMHTMQALLLHNHATCFHSTDSMSRTVYNHNNKSLTIIRHFVCHLLSICLLRRIQILVPKCCRLVTLKQVGSALTTTNRLLLFVLLFRTSVGGICCCFAAP